MSESKLKLDCTGCGASLFQTDNIEVYKCERCDTSYKISFNNDGISLTKIEKKILSFVEDYYDFREKLKRDELKINCLVCNCSLERTVFKDVFECKDCDIYIKPTFEDGKVKIVEPDTEIILKLDIEKLEKESSSLVSKSFSPESNLTSNQFVFLLIWGLLLLFSALFSVPLWGEDAPFEFLIVLLFVVVIFLAFLYKSFNENNASRISHYYRILTAKFNERFLDDRIGKNT